MSIAVVAPPPLKPCEPGLSAGSAATVLRGLGADARSIDASIGWHRHALAPDRLAARVERLRERGAPAPALRAFAHGARAGGAALREGRTYEDRRVYTSAVGHLEQALGLAATVTPGIRLGVAMVSCVDPPRRLESSAALEELAELAGPFDEYFLDELLPELEARAVDTVAVSLTYQQQAPAAFRLAALLGERLPALRRVLGGPLPACWKAVGTPLAAAPFTRFDLVLGGGDEDLALLAGAPAASPPPAGPLRVAFDEAPWGEYLAPAPIVPLALGRGCSYRRCAFCPDHLHPRHRPCGVEPLEGYLREVAAAFPAGAMLHLTDSALPPEHLGRVAATVRSEGLPLRFHGFVRLEEAFADPAFARDLAAGGCALLQLGVESASPRLLERIGKGRPPDLVPGVLRALADAGVRAQVYLLFGLPGETDEDREETLAFVEREAPRIQSVNVALLNLPRGSPMHRAPSRYGITEVLPFHGSTDLSLYDDFRCGASHPRLEARRWLGARFWKSEAVRAIEGGLRNPFKANHLPFMPLNNLRG